MFFIVITIDKLFYFLKKLGHEIVAIILRPEVLQ